MLKAESIPGITYTAKLFVRPRDLNRRKVGINPPLTYIVITQNSDTCLAKIKSLRLTINASMAFVTRARAVPITVLATVTTAPVIRLSLDKTVS